MPLKTHHEDLPGVNLTSMMDVVFLLLIFFLVGTQFTGRERKIPLQVPQVGPTAALVKAPSKRSVNVLRNGQLQLDGQDVDLPRLEAELTRARQQYAGLGVQVRADSQIHFQRVAEVLAACRQAGVAELSVAVRMLPEGKP